MNYLAHAFLSPPDDAVLLGNMACDMIRPSDAESLPEGIRNGMALHHAIDRSADSHGAFREIRSLLHRRHLPYAGVLLDVILDHYLARYWQDYAEISLQDFSSRVYDVLSVSIKDQLIPGHFNRLASALITNDWFGSYASMKGLSLALGRLNYRSSREIPVSLIMETVNLEYERIRLSFIELMNSLTGSYGHIQ
ncbi:MAG: ACP phosphodiesterase [Spirochaetales bacterium]|nr:ACP phosphodiesterase [Spirochaetales bacterium]